MTITFYGVPGTWALWDWGFQADVARKLPGTGEWDGLYAELLGQAGPAFRWQGVFYPASFGPVAPPAWAPTAPSYKDSVKAGVEEVVRLINSDPNPFVLSGYSQGGEVVGRVRYELVAGRLQHRKNDCLMSITFGDPTRQVEDIELMGGKGAGISRFKIPPCPFPCITYAAPGDMYCTTPVSGDAGDNMHAVYEALTSLGGQLSFEKILTRTLKLLADPFDGAVGVIEALIRAAMVQAHGTYGPWVDDAVARVKALAE